MEHPGETNRPPASAFLLVDSQDRHQISSQTDNFGTATFVLATTTQPLNDFIIQKRQTFLSGFFTRIAVTEVRFEYMTPNVNERNNILSVYDQFGVEHEVTVGEFFYTPDELATELAAELASTIPGQTWTVVYTNSAFTITSDEDFFLQPYLYDTLQQTLSGLFYMMGFNIVVNGPDGNAPAQQGAVFPNMTYTRYIDVCSRQLTQYQKVKDNSTRENQTPAVLCRLYLGNYTTEGVGVGNTTASTQWPGCAPAIIQRIYNVPKYSSWSPGAFIDQIDIQLRDDAGNLLYIPGNNVSDEASNARNSPNQFQLTLHCSES